MCVCGSEKINAKVEGMKLFPAFSAASLTIHLSFRFPSLSSPVYTVHCSLYTQAYIYTNKD